ncbi:MAG TPA: hypothetical protein VER17_05055 [Tepidisphaeraceae bacterium]|nr:hypothetical protein [Tepidisphaeraceae bacterium]
MAPALARAGTSVNASGPVQQGTSTSPGDYANNYPAVTISLSGQVALRNFTAGAGISTLRPNASSTFYFGPSGTPVTYYAANDGGAYVQLAKKDFTTGDFGLGATSIANAPVTQGHSAIRVEWHEQGSVQGLNDLINDQVGYTTGAGGTGIISNVASRGPSVSNPTWVNTNQFTAGGTLNGHVLAGGNFGDTYDTSVYDRASGRNLQGGQNRIQYSQGEHKTENFAVAGTPSRSAAPGAPGFGTGNPALAPAATPLGLGNAGGRQSFFPQSYANQSSDKVDPESPAGQAYAPGPWNTAGANNIDSQQFAVTAVTYSANPGTGLYRLNKGDAQWLLTAGRLANGADFNSVSRANDAGQRTVPAVNVGVDPSWAVGENDDGNTSGTAAQNAQRSLGGAIRFSGKTSGTDSRGAIAQSRMAFGPLSIAEARGAASAAPVRALDIDFNHLTDSGNPADFKRVTFDNIINFDYKAVLISHINTVKRPRPDLLSAYRASNPGASDAQVQAWWNNLSSAQTGIKGDRFGNVKSFTDNILQSVGTAASGLTQASVNNPADALYIAGYLVPGLLNYSREVDGGPLAPKNLTPAQLAVQQEVRDNYGPLFSPDGSAGANAQTIGTAATYGALNAGAPAINGAIPITAKDAAGNPVANGVVAPRGNYLFGNFRQNGWRDFAAVKESLNAVLSLRSADGAANSIYAADGGVANGTIISSLAGSPGWATTANTKGDLIVLGDFDSNGRFDGKDVYLLARGASLADSAATDQLTTASGATFADAVRNPNAVLRKNAALDYLDAQLTSAADPNQQFVRATASANAANDPTGANAFNKRDVNRDGLVDFVDAVTSDKFFGHDYHNLDHVLAATSNVRVGDAPKPISLVDAELTDNGTITQPDLDVVNGALAGSAGRETWTGTLVKSGAGSLALNYAAGSFKVNSGAALHINAGAVTVGGSADPFTDNGAGATAGQHVAVASNGVSTSFTIAAGSKEVASVSGTGRTTVSAGATLTSGSVVQARLEVNGNLRVRSGGDGGGAKVVAVQSLALGAAGRIDLANNKLIVGAAGGGEVGTASGGTYSGISGWIQSARNAGAWNGPGIGTSEPAAATGLTALGIKPATAAGTFGGVSIAAGDILVLYTYAGDADLNGKLDGDDYFQIDSHVNGPASAASWFHGDFDYNGKINGDDYFLLDRNIGRQTLGTFAAGGGIAASGLSADVAAVPEPGAVAWLAVACLTGLTRPRRRAR